MPWISQKNNQVGSKGGIITILKPSSLKTHCSETQGRPNLGAFRILANRVKRIVKKKSEEIAPLNLQ
jgi:hypothetical protein